MTYDKFIELYPWFDLFLELFKGVVPTFVAILAIAVNNYKSNKRDKRNKRIDMIIKYEEGLIEKISLLESVLEEVYDSFSDVLKCKDINDLSLLCSKYDDYKSKLIKINIELYNFTFCAQDILEATIDSKEISDDIRDIIKSMEQVVGNHAENNGPLTGISEHERIKIKEIRDDIIKFNSWHALDMKRIQEKMYSLIK